MASIKVKAAADTARPYVERALTDEEFRDSLRSAFVAAKEIYEELVPQKSVAGVAAKVATDEDLQQSLKRTMAELRNAADLLQAERKSHTGRNLLLVLVGVAIGILFNPFTGPDTRRWVRGRVSGGDFAYNGHAKAETISA
jgi:predicted RNA-binding protein